MGLRSLFSGITGLQVSGMAMSIIGDNLANAQTTGFKRSRGIFEDLIAQNIASRTAGNQVGLGATTGAVLREYVQGSLTNSARALDMAINGEGWFQLQNRTTTGSDVTTTTTYYTRAGHFTLDKNGYIVNPEGYILQGWTLDPTSGERQSFGNIQMANTRLAGNTTTKVNLSVNLNPNASIHTDFVYYMHSDSSAGLSAGDPIFSGAASTTVSFTIDKVSATSTVSFTVTSGMSLASARGALSTALGSNGSVSTAGSSGNVILTVDPTGNAWRITNITDETLLDFDGDGSTAGASSTLPTDRRVGPSGEDFSASDADSYDYTVSTNVYDQQGNSHTLNIYFRKTANNTWTWYAISDDSLTQGTQSGTLVFDNSGDITTGDPGSATFDFISGVNQTIQIDFSPSGTYGATTQNGNSYVTYFLGQDGYGPGSLQDLQVNQQGVISGLYSNGEKLTLAQVALAKFVNNHGLNREGGNLFTETIDSGEPVLNPPEEGGNGSIYGNALEESNVDVAEEFVNMINAQRSFQANAKVISASDQLLAELMNIRR